MHAQLWDLLSLTLRVRVVGFAGNIFSLACINGRIFVGCQDTTIKVCPLPGLCSTLRYHHTRSPSFACVCACVCVCVCVCVRVRVRVVCRVYSIRETRSSLSWCGSEGLPAASD